MARGVAAPARPKGPAEVVGFSAARQPAALAPRSADNADLDGARAPSGGRAGPLWFCSSI